MKKTIKPILVALLAVLFVMSACALVACKLTPQPKLDVTVSNNADVKVGDSLDSVKQYLTVKYTDSDNKTTTVTDYQLQGTLTEGQTTLTVKYQGLTATCKITVKANTQQGGDPTKPTVTVNANGGTVGDFTVNDDGTLTPPSTTPTKTGYVFDGYFKDADCTIAWNFDTDKVTVDITVTIYVKWKPESGDTPITKPTVTVNTNGGTFNGSITVNDDNTITEPSTTPTRPNYKFDGWYKDEDCTIKWNFATDKVTVNITIYIKWIRVYTVTFNTNGGSTVAPIEVDENTTITKPADSTREGYTFDGWFKNTNCTTAWNFATDKVTKNTTLYAKWNKLIVDTLDLEYTLSDNGEVYYVTGIGTATATDIVIPSTYEGKPVTAIAEKAFYGNSKIRSITIGENVNTIGKNAFAWCDVETVYWNAINCSNNTGEDAPFIQCQKLKTVIFGDKVKRIPAFAFYSCKNITSITIGNCMAKIEQNAFMGCDNLTTVYWNAVACLDAGTATKSVFASCQNLTTMVIGDDVTAVTPYVFSGCSKLKYNEYENALYLGNASNPYVVLVKAKSTGIVSCTINESTKIICDDAFKSCNKLVYNEYDKALYLGNTLNPYLVLMKAKSTSITECTINNKTKFIYNYAFGGCSKLKVTMGDNVTSIGYRAFYGCSRLSSITIPDSVTSIDGQAFCNCNNLETVYWNATACVNAGSNSHPIFDNCSNLTTIAISDNVTVIPGYAFYNCSSLKKIDFDGTEEQWKAIKKGICWNQGAYAAEIVFKDNGNIPTIKHTVTFNTSGGSAIAPIEVDENTTITKPADPTREGYTFDGWFKNTNCTTAWNFATDKVTKNTTLYAKWEKNNDQSVVNKYTVTFNTNGGSEINSLTGIAENSTITAPVNPTKDGHDFVGWYKDEDCTTPWNFATDKVTENTNLYAKWEKIITKYTVTFETNGGSAIEPIEVDENALIKKPATPTRDDYVFVGWYKDVDCANIWNFDSDVIIEDVTLYAKWLRIGQTEGLQYTLNHNGESYSVSGIGSVIEDDIVIPSTHIDKPVTTIGNYAFRNCDKLTSVTIPDSITTIGDYAFDGCSSLTSVAIPNSITTIGDYAFFNCSSLTSITIPDSVTTIARAFSRCSSLTSITMGNGVTSIADDAFYNCNNLQYNEYDNALYLGNDSNPYVVLVKAKLANINSCTINNNTKIIYCRAFYNCSSLTSIIIPNGVTTIGDYAFFKCSSLTSIIIPYSVITIGDGVFFDCSGLETVYWNATACTRVGQYLSMYIDCTIWRNCSNLTAVEIGDNVTTIPSYAFYGCSSITSIIIPNSVTTIGHYTFSSCKNLTSITIGNGVTIIGDHAFDGCSSLTNVTIPDSVTTIGSSVFNDCSSLQYNEYDNALYLGNDSNPYVVLVKAKLANINSCTINNNTKIINYRAFSNCSSLTSIIVPDSVTSIGGSAFFGCSGLQSITLPFVGSSAKAATDTSQYLFGYIFGTISYTGGVRTQQFYFVGSTNSTTYNTYYIPSNLKSVIITGGDIFYGAFFNCSSLTSIIIPDSVTIVGESAFGGCSNLTSVAIGNSVTTIDSYAFSNCKSLTKIKFNGTIEQWNAIEKGNGWNYSVPATKVICSDGEVAL